MSETSNPAAVPAPATAPAPVTAPAPAAEPAGSGLNKNILLIVALVVLILFVPLVLWMLAGTTVKEETVWARRVYVYGTVEAIVFTAVGWLFGREVHREQASSAKQDAQEAKGEAASARQEASTKSEEAAVAKTKGHALAAAVRNTAPPTTGTRGRGGSATVGLEGTASQPPQNLRSLADELFPPA